MAKTQEKLKYTTDRQINSTETNDFAEGVRDENLWADNGWDSEIPLDDRLPDILDETGIRDSEVYNEYGYTNLDQ